MQKDRQIHVKMLETPLTEMEQLLPSPYLQAVGMELHQSARTSLFQSN